MWYKVNAIKSRVLDKNNNTSIIYALTHLRTYALTHLRTYALTHLRTTLPRFMRPSLCAGSTALGFKQRRILSIWYLSQRARRRRYQPSIARRCNLTTHPLFWFNDNSKQHDKCFHKRNARFRRQNAESFVRNFRFFGSRITASFIHGSVLPCKEREMVYVRFYR